MKLFQSIARQTTKISQPSVFITLNRFYSEASVAHLAPNVQKYILEKAELCQPDDIVICDGSSEENQRLIATLIEQKLIKPIPKLENCYLAKTDPKDVARVESKTVISTDSERETIPIPQKGIEGTYTNLYLRVWSLDLETRIFFQCYKHFQKIQYFEHHYT